MAKFQEEALSKATTFPKVTEISYSTCSVHRRENDEVVQNVLKQENNSEKWELKDLKEKFPGFSKEGPTVHLEPFVAATNGFYVAVLKRK